MTSPIRDDDYITFCLDVRQHLRNTTELWTESRVVQATDWIDGIVQP